MIYLVEDDASIRDLVLYTLQKNGLETQGFETGKAFWEALETALPRLVILDIMLPGEDGLSILKRLRANPSTRKLPVLMLTAKDSEYDTVLGLESGADDYLSKPGTGMMELAARVKSLLRRLDLDQGAEEYHAGSLYVNVPRHTVLAGGEEIFLTVKEFDLLVYLLKNTGIVLTRDRLLAAVWGYGSAAESRTVDTHILTLRTKLGEAGSLIRTVRGVGYKADGQA
ncbi:MAG: response regulator transcription factor [Treponema sp.]|jgi:two-component system alkaline phosphatase synthesis response regulator PhoP|nr:response regulator transcription factor [Treponema sp.]